MRPALPSPDAIAVALVACCKAFGEDPLLLAAGAYPDSLAAFHAIEALKRCYPQTSYRVLFAGCGVGWADASELDRVRRDVRWNPALIELAMCKAAAVRDAEVRNA